MDNLPEDERLQLEQLLETKSEEHVSRVAEILHKRYHKLIYYFLRIFDLPDEDRDDIFNQVFLKVLRGLSGIQHYDNLKSWIVTITKNEIYNHINKKDRERTVYYPIRNEVTSISITDAFSRRIRNHEQEVYSNQIRTAIEECLQSVDEIYRRPFLLRFRDNLRWKRVAEILGIKQDTARKRSDKARKILVQLLKIRHGIE